MSEVASQRDGATTGRAAEGALEPQNSSSTEGDGSRSLLERLRELEAENSALSMANESQREAYERCLDEVANHVVQALLNQKDLREECIKLKMRVFDLERQNRTLSELFQQKLQVTAGSQVQVMSESLLEHPSEPPVPGPVKITDPLTEAQMQFGGEKTRSGSHGPKAPTSSMEALSPFFKKKAHILEVLRKLEENDPLKFHPSSGFCPYRDFSQSNLDLDGPEHVNGEDPGTEYASCQSCLKFSHKGLDGLFKWKQETSESSSASSPTKGEKVGLDPSGPTMGDLPSSSADIAEETPAELKQIVSTKSYLYSLIRETEPKCSLGGGSVESCLGEESKACDGILNFSLEGKFLGPHCHTQTGPALNELVIADGLKHVKAVTYPGFSAENYLQVECSLPEATKSSLYASTSGGKLDSSSAEQVCNGLFFTGDACFAKKADSFLSAGSAEKSNRSFLQQASQGKAKVIPSPTSPCGMVDTKSSPISSPSKLLKFLKISSLGERAQAANPLRLSPQLTRSSKIPCRNNNYEVYHSPVLSRKTVPVERDRPVAACSKTDSYPATHSAPTSPPKPDVPPAPNGELAYSSHSAPKPTGRLGSSHLSRLGSEIQPFRSCQKIPHYENVSDISSFGPTDTSARFLDRLHQATFSAFGSSESLTSSPGPPSSTDGKRDSSPAGEPSPTLIDETAATVDDRSTYAENLAWYKMHGPQGDCLYQASSEDVGLEDKAQSDGLATTVSEVSSSLHKRSSKAMGDTGHLPFKERLAALGKLKSTEDLRQHLELDAQSCPVSRERSKTAERMGDRSSVGSDPRHVKYTDSMDSKPYPKAAPKPQVPEFGGRSLPGAPTAPKATNDAYCSKACTAKTEVTKHKAGGPSSTSVADSSQALRNYVKCSSAPVPSHGSRATATSPQGSPTKVPSKSPLKTPTKGGRQVQEEQRPCASQKRSPRACASLEDKGKSPAHGERKKNLDGLSSPAKTAQVESQGDQSTQSAIEEKVMKGIEENMLKLQELDKGQVSEVKQKASNGIASWFGLKKSKLPALNRKPDMPKPKEDKKEWKLNVSSSSSSSSKDPKVAVAKKKLEAEGLNISKLMEKAEDLRKALEEERAFMNGMALEKTGRGHPCNVPVEMPTVYREAASDTFMQQLLNRVDDRDAPCDKEQRCRRLSFDSKKSRPLFSSQRNGVISHLKVRGDVIEKSAGMGGKDDVTSEESLGETVHSQHFTGSSTRTLDSGIGTFPLPDYASSPSGKGIPKSKPHCEPESSGSPAKHGPGTKMPRKARTLERELSSLDEAFAQDEDLNPQLYSTVLDSKGLSTNHLSSFVREAVDVYGAHVKTQPSKNWTFPNSKASASTTDMYLGVTSELDIVHDEQPLHRQSTKQCLPQSGRDPDASSLPLPSSLGFGRRLKSRTPSTAEVTKDAVLDMSRERSDDMISPNRPSALETPESLSDSLYDSLSSCGSQG
ncbi:nck-associated protein 5-like [Erpetoichthys calabaricus]|uniref:nck-associated protein 5-like n=1 Tax=Erpetoichthys calabaricus TaxID=27687 RepID=UPI00223461BF|nr:nck-associated protein 5-like [Erpetoichthys calabaricus]XP_051780986.1 nck-associated protein 5-like [Erpetoichthys calabaricus]